MQVRPRVQDKPLEYFDNYASRWDLNQNLVFDNYQEPDYFIRLFDLDKEPKFYTDAEALGFYAWHWPTYNSNIFLHEISHIAEFSDKRWQRIDGRGFHFEGDITSDWWPLEKRRLGVLRELRTMGIQRKLAEMGTVLPLEYWLRRIPIPFGTTQVGLTQDQMCVEFYRGYSLMSVDQIVDRFKQFLRSYVP